MNANGTGQTNLTNNGSLVDERPSWSPAGDKIAFVRGAFNNAEVYTMNPDGTGATRITNNTLIDASPSWQPIPAPPAGYARPKGAGPLVGLAGARLQAVQVPEPHTRAAARASALQPAEAVLATPDGWHPRCQRGSRELRRLVKINPIAGDPGTPADEADVAVQLTIADVRKTRPHRLHGPAARAGRIPAPDRPENASGGGSPIDAATSTDATVGVHRPVRRDRGLNIGSQLQPHHHARRDQPGAVKESKRAILAVRPHRRCGTAAPDGHRARRRTTICSLTQGIFVP